VNLPSLLSLLVTVIINGAALAATTTTNQLHALQFSSEPPTPISGHHYATLSLQFKYPPNEPQIYLLEKSHQLIIDLANTDNQAVASPAALPTPVSALKVASSDTATRIVVTLEKRLSYQLYHQKQTLFLSLYDPPTPAQPTEHLLIDLTLEQEPIASALRKITRSAGQNLLINGEISGTTSLHLQQVRWRDAFDLLIAQNRLQLTEQSGILVVSPPPVDSTAAEVAPEPPAIETITEMKTVMIPLHYANAADLKKTLESGDKNPLLSAHGVLGVDERTNTLIIQEQEERIKPIRRLIEQLDISSKQVLIESRIVIASNDFSSELGVRLGLTHLESSPQQWGFSLSGSSEAANQALSGTTPAISGGENRLAVNLPITAAAGRIGLTLAKLSSGSLIDLELSAAQLEGKTEIVASPRILTSDGYEATIQQGVQIPYRSDTLSGGTDVSFKDAVMELRVTPQITPDHQIIMSLQVKKDAVGAIFCDNCEPSVDTREVKTRVMIGDGETLVIGGIYEERKTDSVNRVPLLADLPIIGQLFRSQRESDGKGELLIFITPTILSE
jgi:type IV pilus assembly protein PilQ